MKCKSKLLSRMYSKGQEDFLTSAHRVHGDKYDYSGSKYSKSIELVEIRCRKHGFFKQLANSHLSGFGCIECGIEKNTKLPKELRTLVKRVRVTISQSFIRESVPKGTKSRDLLGCSWEHLKGHLEDNPYGFTVGEEGLDIDHIVPTSSAKNREDVMLLSHYSNLQLLPSVYNRNIKRNKPFDEAHFSDWLSSNKIKII